MLLLLKKLFFIATVFTPPSIATVYTPPSIATVYTLQSTTGGTRTVILQDASGQLVNVVVADEKVGADFLS